MTKRTTIMSVVLLAVLVALAFLSVGITLNNTTDVAYADSAIEVRTSAEFLAKVATGGKMKVMSDIQVQSYAYALGGDLTIDLNGHSVSVAPQYNFMHFSTNGYALKFESSKAGMGSFDGYVMMSKQSGNTTNSRLTILNGVYVSVVEVYMDKGYRFNDLYFDYVQLNNGMIGRFWSQFAYGKNDYNFSNGSNDYNMLYEKFVLGDNPLYINNQRVNSKDELFAGASLSSTFSFKNVACISDLDSINTSLTTEIVTAPTNTTKGVATISTYYANPVVYTQYFGKIYAAFYRSVNGGGYYQAVGGNFFDNGFVLDDRTLELGANSYTYYAIIKGSTANRSLEQTTDKYTIYTAPLDPINVGISGQENAVTGSDVTLTGVYKQNPNNVSGNIIKNEYRWQKYNEDTEEWVDIAGAAKATYKPSTGTAGATKYRFGVRTMGKGNQASEWVFSDEFDFVVGVYDSPITKLSNPTEIEEVKGYDVQVGATVDNATYFDGVTYQWYYVWGHAEGTPLYYAIKNGEKNGYTFANADTATLTISRATTNDRPLIVRCQVTGTKNGYKRNANTEDVSVSFIDLPLPAINTQPQGANLMQGNGTHAIAVYASTKQGTLTYQWQSSEDGNVWENIANANAYNYLVDTSVATNGKYYRCVVSNAAGSVNSEAAKFVITDSTVLNAALTSGLEATFVDGNSDYTLDNDNRTLVCHLGDDFLIGFGANEGNASTSEKTLGTDWRNETGLGENGMGKWYLDTSMAGTFEYYGRFYAEYDDGLGHVQSVDFNRENDERMRFTVIVLPREDEAEIAPLTVELGGSETIDIASADYPLIFTNGDVTTNAITDFLGNHKASSYYHFVLGYRLYVGIPNENGEIEYICFAQTDFYDNGTGTYNNAQDLIFDTSAEKLADLAHGIETLDGVYDAYVVMDYQIIVNENVDNIFTVKRGAFEGHHFALTVVAPCTHEHVTTTYTFDNDETYGAYIMIANKCDICEEDLAGAYIWVYRTGEADGLPLISQAATCTEDGMRAHKHFTRGDYDKYYIEDSATHWVECADPSTLVIKAGHNYQSVAAVGATCTTDGNHAHFECSVCHKKYVQDGTEYYEVEPESLVIDAFHKHLDLIAEVPATCSEFGVREYYHCSHCDKNFTDTLGEHEIADLNAWKAGDGKIEKAAHAWGDWHVVTPATEMQDGVEERVCQNNPEHKEQRSITASGFSYTTDEQGIKVFEHSAALGTANDFAALFAAAKQANGKIKIIAGDLVLIFDVNAVNAIGGNAANLTANVLTSNFGIDGLEGIQSVIELSLGNTNFANGTVSVKLPFTTAVPEGKVAKVYYVNGNDKTDMNATFADGKVSFETNHFSKFAVVFEDEQTAPVDPTPEKKGLSGGAIAGIVIGSVFGALLIACAVLFLLNKKGVIKLGKKD